MISMFYYRDPQVTSVLHEYETSNNNTIKLISPNMNIPMVVLQTSTGDDADAGIFSGTLPIDYESRRYIHVTIKNIIKEYDDEGVLTTHKVSSDLEKCSSKHLSNTEYEKTFLANQINGRNENYYCAKSD